MPFTCEAPTLSVTILKYKLETLKNIKKFRTIYKGRLHTL